MQNKKDGSRFPNLKSDSSLKYFKKGSKSSLKLHLFATLVRLESDFETGIILYQQNALKLSK